jgi:hypothetical protein
MSMAFFVWSCAMLVKPVGGQTFSLGKDTVYEGAYLGTGYYDSVSLQNNGPDTLVIDSINLIRDTVVFPDVHVELHVRPSSGMGAYAGGYYFSTQYYYPPYGDASTPCIRLKGMATVFLLDFYLDGYPFPLPKRAATDGADALTRGDTISIRLAFVSGASSDTLTIVGVYDPVSVSRARPPHRYRTSNQSGHTYTLLGNRGGTGNQASGIRYVVGDHGERCAVVRVRGCASGEGGAR